MNKVSQIAHQIFLKGKKKFFLPKNQYINHELFYYKTPCLYEWGTYTQVLYLAMLM